MDWGLCSEVVAIVADQGTEKGIADVGKLTSLEEGALGNPGEVHHAFVNAMWMPEHLHIFNNALENSITSLPVWEQFMHKLRSVERFLQDYSLRTLFRATCLVTMPAVSALFRSYSGSHVEWRWEFLEKSLDKLLPLLPHMVAHLNVDAMLNSDEGKVDPAIVKEARAALDLPFFTEFCELIRSVGKCIYRFTHMLEGCRCHSHIWTGRGTFRTKAARMQELTGFKSCFWKGRMGPWLQVAGIPLMAQMINDSTTDKLQEFLSAMDASRRGSFVNVDSLVKTRLIDELTQKLSFHKEIPYSCMGIMWGEFPGGGMQASPRTLRRRTLRSTTS